MTRIDYDTAVLLSEAIPDFWSDVVWFVNKSGDISAADLKDWYTKYEDKGYAKYPMPYAEDFVGYLKSEYQIYVWLEPTFEEAAPLPIWTAYVHHNGQTWKCTESRDSDEALEKSIVEALRYIKDNNIKQVNEES